MITISARVNLCSAVSIADASFQGSYSVIQSWEICKDAICSVPFFSFLFQPDFWDILHSCACPLQKALILLRFQ